MFPDRHSRSFLDPGVLSRLAGFPLLPRRPMQGSVSGRHPSPHRGSSVEFAEYRKYVPGDDLRRLDWRAYGRSDRFFVKEFEADTNLRCCLVVDTSGSMGFGSGGVTKLEYARRIAGALGHLALQQGDAVGLVVRRRRDRAEHPARAQSVAPDDRFRRARANPAAGADPARAGAARAGRDDLAAGARGHHLGPVRRARRAAVVLPAPAVPASTTRRSFICSTRRSWALISAGRCGFSTWKGARRSSPSPTRSPTATTRRSAGYLDGLATGGAGIGRRLSPGHDRRETTSRF